MEMCVVCQETIDDNSPSSTTLCNHRFHSKCFLEAAQASDNCPVCRTSLYPSEEDDDDDDGEEEEEVSRLRTARMETPAEVQVIEFDVSQTSLAYAIFQACKEGNLSEVRAMINENEYLGRAEDGDLDTLLHAAVYSGCNNLLRYLINEALVPVNAINNFRLTALHLAVSSGSVDNITLLLNSGAYIDVQDSAGKTPLIYSSCYNRADVTQLLLDRGASVRTFDSSGDTPLHHATRGKCLSCMRTLLRFPGTDTNASNFVQETPLHVACVCSSYTAVRFLLDSGSDPDLKNKGGKTAVDYVPRDNTRLRNLLAQHT